MAGLEGKKVIIFYDDAVGISRKEGIMTAVSDSDYTLDNKLIIPKNRVIRIEVKE